MHLDLDLFTLSECEHTEVFTDHESRDVTVLVMKAETLIRTAHKKISYLIGQDSSSKPCFNALLYLMHISWFYTIKLMIFQNMQI